MGEDASKCATEPFCQPASKVHESQIDGGGASAKKNRKNTKENTKENNEVVVKTAGKANKKSRNGVSDIFGSIKGLAGKAMDHLTGKSGEEKTKGDEKKEEEK